MTDRDKPTQADLRRGIVMAYASTHPCCTLNAVANGTGMPLVMTRYYVTQLEQRGALNVDRSKKWWCIYLPGTVMAEIPQARAIVDPDLWTLWTWMHTQDRLYHSRILKHARKEWSWSPTTTRHRLRRLIDAGLLARINGKARKAKHAPVPPRFKSHGAPT
jgi:hypothetical protein